MSSIVKQVLLGTLLGLIVSVIGSFVVVCILLPTTNLENVFIDLLKSGVITKIITLGTLPNVIVFHLLIKNSKDYYARGVLMAVFILAIAFAILKLL